MTPEKKSAEHQPEFATPAVRMAMWRRHRRLAQEHFRNGDTGAGMDNIREAARWIITAVEASSLLKRMSYLEEIRRSRGETG